MDEASELIGSEVEPAGPEVVEGIETPVGATTGGASDEAAAGGGAGAGGGAAEPGGPGTMFSVALAQFALNPSSDFAAVGLMAKTIPD